MFKRIREIFGGKSLIEDALADSWAMLETDKQMFDASVRSLRQQDSSEVEIDIYEADRKINQSQQEIRRKVLTHLAVSGSMNLSIGLGLVSIVIDMERIGDYTKNIYELAKVHPSRLSGGEWENDVKVAESTVSRHRGSLSEALRGSDVELANQIIKDMSMVKAHCDKYVMRLMMRLIKGNTESVDKREAVSLVLYMQYLNRVASHLQNMATSIVNPFDKIGYISREATDIPASPDYA